MAAASPNNSLLEASGDASSQPSTPIQGQSTVSLLCERCGEGTTFGNSHANNPRNPYKRICKECSTTDRTLNRRCGSGKKSSTPKSDVEKQSESEHKAPRDKLKIMPAADRQDWYKRKKAERNAEEGGNSKRSLTDTQGTVKQGTEKSLSKGELDLFEPFEEWAPRQMLLGRYKNESDAKAAFKLECGKPGAVTMEIRGETCLSRFRGVEVNKCTKSAMTSETAQTMAVDSVEDFQRFEKEAASASGKFARSIGTDHCSSLPKSGPKLTAADVDHAVDFDDISANNVMKGLLVKDLESKQQAEAAEASLFLEEARLAAEEQKAKAKEKAAEAKEAAGQAPLDKAVEKLGLQNEIAVAESNLGTLRLAFHRQASSTEARIRSILAEMDTEEFSEELQGKMKSIEEARNELEKEHAKILKEHRDFHGQEHTGHEYKEKARDLKATCKRASSLSVHICVQDKIKQLGAYRDNMNKKCQEKVKQDSKRSAKRCRLDSPGPSAKCMETPLLVAGAIQHAQGCEAKNSLNRNLRWVLQVELQESNMPSVVCMPSDKTGFLIQQISGPEYYESQKAWVADVMKKGQQQVTSATVAKPAVANKIKQLIKTSAPLIEPVTSVQADLKEVFAPKFYQIAAKGWSLALLPNYGLFDCRLHLEGSETVFGIPVSIIEGETFAAKEAALAKMTIQQFMQLVDSQGFSYHAKEGALHVIPGRLAILIVGDAGSTTHGLQWQVPGGKPNAKEAFANLKQVVSEFPSLGSEGSTHMTLIDMYQEMLG